MEVEFTYFWTWKIKFRLQLGLLGVKQTKTRQEPLVLYYKNLL